MNEEIKKKNSEKRFRIILENANDLITIINERSEYEYLNETAHLKILGYNREELMSKPALEFVHPDDREKAVIELKKAFEIGETSVELRLKSKSGSYVWVDAKSKSFIDQDGKRKLLGIARDITDNKKIENALKESEEKYKNLFKSIPDGIVTTSMDGKILSANQAYLNMLGYSLDELKSMNFQLITPEKWRETEAEAIKSFMPEGYGTFEKEYIRKDGSIFPISLTAWLIKDEQGNPIKIAGFVEDITERKKAEEDLRVKDNAIKSSINAIALADLSGNLTYVNPSFLKMWGYSSEKEVLGRSNLDFWQMKEKAAKVMEALIERGNWIGELVAKRKNGTFFDVQLSASLILDYHDKPILVMASFIDITDRKKAERELKESEEFLKIIIEKAVPPFVIIDFEGTILMVNESALKFSGYSREEVLKMNASDIALEIIPMEHRKKIWEKLEFGKQIEVSGTQKRKDGSVFPTETTLVKLKLKNQPVIAAFFRDITERKEEEQKLKISEEMYRLISENAHDMISLVDSEGKFIYCNEAFKRILGYAPEEIIGISTSKLIHPEDLDKVYNDYKKLNQIDSIKNELRVLCKDNSYKWLESITKGMRDENNIITKLIGISRDITERKKAEQKIKESEEKYRNLYENALVGLWTSRIDGGNFLRANDTAARIAGFDNAEDLMNNCTAIELFNYETRIEFIRQLKEYGEKSDFEAVLIDKNGNERDILVSGKINPEKGTIEGSFIDIMDMKRAQKELKTSEVKYRNIIENTMEGYFEVDLKGNFTYFNEALCEMSGYTREESKGTSFSTYMTEEDSRKTFNVFNKVYNTGIPEKNFQYEFFRKNGKKVYGESSVYLRYDSEGNKIGFSGFLRDVTEKQETEQNLKESEEKFRTITEQSLMGILILQDDVVKYVNKQYTELVGYETEEIKSWQPGEFFKIMHPEDRDMIMRHAELRQKGLKDEINHYFHRVIKKTGEIVWCEIFAKTINYKGRPADLITVVDKTDVKEAEEKLKESEEKFRTITEQSLMGVTIIQDNKVKYINQQFAELSGYTIDEAKSLQLKEIYEVIHPEDRKMVMEQFMKKQEGSQDVTNHYQYRIIKKTGEIVWLDNFSKTINYMGRPADLVTVIDITERKLAEERLKESQEKYKNMINDLDLGFFQAKWDGTILNVNPAFRMIMGYSHSEELIGKKISFFLKNPEDQKKYSEELLENNIVDNYITHGQNIYGEELILQTDSHLKRDEDGNPMEIEGTIADITERFKLEQKLRLSEERYRFLFENSPLAIILSDLNGVIREINPATEKLIGYLKKEVIGRTYLNLSIVHPDDLPIVEERIKQYIKGDTPPPIDVKFYRKDGSLLWANINSNIIKIGNETFLHVMCQDITERKKAELLVKEEIEKLKELDQIRKDLISRVSHELKTPLIPVLGGVEYLLYSYSDKFEKEQIELLEMIQKGGKRLGKLVERLLDITRIEYDKLILNRQLTNLNEIIKETANDMKYLIKDRKINLNLVVPEDLFLEIDGMRIEQVITNLLSNALKNTPPNGRVSLGLEKYGNWAIISVSDTGVGFTEDEMKKIFTKFGKIERQGEGLEYINMEGSGLGLFITKQIVDLHGGKIWVESTGRNRGCIFKVRLPII